MTQDEAIEYLKHLAVEVLATVAHLEKTRSSIETSHITKVIELNHLRAVTATRKLKEVPAQTSSKI